VLENVKKIVVEVRLYATLNRCGPERKMGEAVHCQVPEGTTVGDLLAHELNVPLNEVKTVFVNGVSRAFDYVLADGERVAAFPAVGGG